MEALSRHWDSSNREGICLLCKIVEPALGTLEHFLLGGDCPALAEAHLQMLSFFESYMVSRPYLLPIMKTYWNSTADLTMQLLLDCSVLPDIIRIEQESSHPVLKDIFFMSRTYIFKVMTIQRRRLEYIKIQSVAQCP